MEKNPNVTGLQEKLNRSAINLLAEVAGCILAESEGIDLANIELVSRGKTGHPLSKDVINGHTGPHREKINLEVRRDGPYEAYPGVFLHPSLLETSGQEKLEAFQQELALARQFFDPFEAFSLRASLEAVAWERAAIRNPAAELAGIWDMPEGLQARERAILARILPFHSLIVGDLLLTAACFAEVLQEPVTIRYGVAKAMTSKGSHCPGVGAMRLGIDAFASRQATGVLPALIVTIGPLAPRQLANFLPGGRKRWVLEDILYPYFMPENQWVTKLIVQEEEPDSSKPALSASLRVGYCRIRQANPCQFNSQR